MPDGGARRAVAFLVVAVASMVLGYVGLHDYLVGNVAVAFRRSSVDLVYDDLQLFVLGSTPVEGAGRFPLTLQVARFLAPATAALAAVEAFRVLLGEQARRWSAAHAAGHAVVAGDGPAALEVARGLRAQFRRVVLVGANPSVAALATRHGLLGVVGDTNDPATLRAAGVGRASVVYACTDLSATNTATVLRSREIGRDRGRPLTAYAQVRDGEIAAALRARRIGTTRDPGFRLDFFSVEQVAARVLVDRYPPSGPQNAGQPLRIVGFGALGQAVLREVGRHREAGGPPVPVVVEQGDTAAVAEFIRRTPVVARNCTPQVPPGPGGPFSLTFVCLPDIEDALRAGLAAAQAAAGGPERTVICLREPSPFGAVLTGTQAVLDDGRGRLAVFGVIEEACVPALINDDLIEQIARAIHRSYLATCAAGGDTPLVNQSMRPWEDLSDSLKRANYAQAADIGRKLDAVDCVVAPEAGNDMAFAFTPAEIEVLAEAEHQRWVDERTGEGYVYGPNRQGNEHPDLVDWASLTSDAQDKDRSAVEQIPAILRDAGFQILRVH